MKIPSTIRISLIVVFALVLFACGGGGGGGSTSNNASDTAPGETIINGRA